MCGALSNIYEAVDMTSGITIKNAAENAYRIADALLEARNKKIN